MDYFLFTNRGDRTVNEDSVGYFENGENRCFVLCDGLGGMGLGDQASQLVVKVFGEQFVADDDSVNFQTNAFLAAQKRLIERQCELKAQKKMKTTAVSLVMNNEIAYIGHVGDSRLYIFSHNKVLKRTLDHSIPQMLALTGEIKDSEIRHHPSRNIVLRVMGIEWEDPMFELMEPISLKKCDAFLLCSDGFWELIEEKDICSLLKDCQSAEEWIGRMAEIVKENGAGQNMDNFSAIGVILRHRKGISLW